MTRQQKIEIWEQTERQRVRFERIYSVVFARTINRQIRRFLAAAEKNGFELELDNLRMYVTYEDMRASFFDMYLKVGRAFNKITENEIKAVTGRFETKDFEMPESVFTMNLQDFVDRVLGKKITFINQTTERWIRDQVANISSAAIRSGSTINEVTTQLQNFFKKETPNFAAYRARRIARTEIVSASNYSKNQVMETVAPAGLQKIWIADLRDLERTRLAHQDVAPVGMRDKFLVGGELLEYPGDPNGSPENIINCFPSYQKVNLDVLNLKKIFRSWFDGEIISLVDSSGKLYLSGTPNHPILTSRGWVPIKDINEFDQIIQSSTIKNKRAANFEVNNIQTSFEEVFNSFFNPSSSMRMVGGIVNFHGHIPTGDINIIDIESLLKHGTVSEIFKTIKNLLFAKPYFGLCFLFRYSLFYGAGAMKIFSSVSNGIISGFSSFLTFLKSHFASSYNIRFAGASQTNTMLLENSLNNISGNTKLFGGFFNRVRLIVKINNSTFINFGLFHKIARVNPFRNTKISKRSVVNADDLSALFNTDTGKIEFITGLKICRHNYKGYVYTLETKTQMYNVNSIIARNCRCTQGIERV